jgi:hypothetical protein
VQGCSLAKLWDRYGVVKLYSNERRFPTILPDFARERIATSGSTRVQGWTSSVTDASQTERDVNASYRAQQRVLQMIGAILAYVGYRCADSAASIFDHSSRKNETADKMAL